MNVTVAGVCSGVGGFDLAFQRAGAQVLWSCENEANCRLLLAHRFPGAHCYSDMLGTEILGAQAPDVFVGGTPCQGFSVAGLRKGLNDDRSNLALRFLQLADHFGPTVILWENVPGVLSDKENAFGCFLAGLVGADAPLVPPEECGGRWTNAGVVAGPRRTAAWRILDSQYFGVAQRRERVFVVASPRAELPFKILFEPEGVRRYSAPSREAGQRAAPTLASRTRGGGGLGTDAECDGALIPFGGNNTEGPIEVATACNAHGGPCGRMDFESETFVASGQGYWDESKVAGALGTEARAIYESTAITHALRADGFDASEDGTGRGTPLVPVIAPPLNAGGNSTGGTRQPGTSVDTCESLIPVAFEYKKDGDSHGDIAPTLRATEHDKSHANGGGHVAIAFTERTRRDGRSFESQDELAYALTNPGNGGKTDSRQIAYTLHGADKTVSTATETELAGSVRTKPPGSIENSSTTAVVQGYAVRRLTPRECERLQAFPTCVILSLCFDRQSSSVNVEVRCLKLPGNALPAEESENGGCARFADVNFWNDQAKREALAAVHVRIGNGETLAAIHSLGRCIWSAAGVDQKSSFRQRMPPGTFAHDIAVAVQRLETEIQTGKAESLQFTMPFILPKPGNLRAEMSGRESGAPASGAENTPTEAMRSTTSSQDRNTQRCDFPETTWLSVEWLARRILRTL